jgi:hypothetical protein
MEWEHDKLAEDLALAEQTCFLRVPLGSPYLDANTQIADVVTVKPAYTRFSMSIFEIKVSRADYLKDVRSGKWEGYLDHCHRFYFAVPVGLVRLDEIPLEAGLAVRGPQGWQFRKAAIKRDVEVPYLTLLSMLFLRERLTQRERSLDHVIRGDWKSIAVKRDGRERAKEVGRILAKAMAGKQSETLYKDMYEELLKDVAHALGMDGSSSYDVYRALRNLSPAGSSTAPAAPGRKSG